MCEATRGAQQRAGESGRERGARSRPGVGTAGGARKEAEIRPGRAGRLDLQRRTEVPLHGGTVLLVLCEMSNLFETAIQRTTAGRHIFDTTISRPPFRLPRALHPAALWHSSPSSPLRPHRHAHHASLRRIPLATCHCACQYADSRRLSLHRGGRPTAPIRASIHAPLSGRLVG